MGETHIQEAKPTVRGKDNASLNAMNGNSRKMQRQSEGSNNGSDTLQEAEAADKKLLLQQTRT
jgi:hypothetical protein